jgi:hypothetical protein
MKKERTSGPVIAVVLLLVALLLAPYVGGYYLLSRKLGNARYFPSSWVAAAFTPMAYIESALTGNQVEATAFPD